MTPKEKAIELYNKMYETGFKPKSVLLRIEQAKECALIAVDEIIEANPIAFDENENCIAKQWWKEVKTEIEKL